MTFTVGHTIRALAIAGAAFGGTAAVLAATGGAATAASAPATGVFRSTTILHAPTGANTQVSANLAGADGELQATVANAGKGAFALSAQEFALFPGGYTSKSLGVKAGDLIKVTLASGDQAQTSVDSNVGLAVRFEDLRTGESSHYGDVSLLAAAPQASPARAGASGKETDCGSFTYEPSLGADGSFGFANLLQPVLSGVDDPNTLVSPSRSAGNVVVTDQSDPNGIRRSIAGLDAKAGDALKVAAQVAPAGKTLSVQLADARTGRAVHLNG